KTGRAVFGALLKCGLEVRVMVHRQEQADDFLAIGACSALVGDMTKIESYREAMVGIEAVYHICPNMHPREVEIGLIAINTALTSGLKQFVYHSVLHPQVEKMPHHWNKLRVEEALFESGINFTIMQPAPYMQNILSGRNLILQEGRYLIPYPVTTRISMVDLEDLGRAVSVVLTEPDHHAAIYEIVGTEALSQTEIADLTGEVLGIKVDAEEITLDRWILKANNAGLGSYQIETLVKMFKYYARFGLHGSNFILKKLLKGEPQDFTGFIRRELLSN
ncbi:MAG: NmrA family NAD(P)-binding protein, partial [Dethiobacteria bacterium]|nr:NmrA family NAD(P)-binding protein [Dethiobacteria bacterium]